MTVTGFMSEPSSGHSILASVDVWVFGSSQNNLVGSLLVFSECFALSIGLDVSGVIISSVAASESVSSVHMSLTTCRVHPPLLWSRGEFGGVVENSNLF